MFNEILTGKASLEEKPKDPYREPVVPDVTRTCTACKQAFTTKANSPSTICASCGLALAQQAAAMPYTYENQNRDDGTGRMIRALLYVGVAIVLAVLKWQMRHH